MTNRSCYIAGFLKDNIKKGPKRVLDISCGDGDLLNILTQAYRSKEVYGLDINSGGLAKGILRGNFDKAIPIRGDAYHLTEKNPKFDIVYLGKDDSVKFRELNEPLRNFDLVTSVNPANMLSHEEALKIRNEGLVKTRRFIPPKVISIPAKQKGHVLYETEIAHQGSWFSGGRTPNEITEDYVNDNLERILKEGEEGGLKHVSHQLIESDGLQRSVDLAVLFKKL